jgi:hypothetical protein
MVDVGGIYRTTYDVYDASGTATVPSTVTLTIYKPDGTQAVSPTITPAAHMIYDYVTATAGRHTGTWATTGPGTARGFTFDVAQVPTTSLVDRAAMKARLNIDSLDTVDDDELDETILVATDIVESKVGAVVPRIWKERQPVGGSLWLRNFPVVSLTSIKPWLTFGVGYDLSLVRLSQDSGRVERLDGYPFIGGPFEVVYIAGRPVVSAAIRQGAKEIIAHLWETQRGGMTFLGSGPGPEADDEMFFSRGKEYTVPRRVLEMLAPDTIAPRVA